VIFRSKKQIIKELEKENARLKDENESLWQLLDEMSASDIENYKQMLVDLYLEKKADSLMITAKKVDA